MKKVAIFMSDFHLGQKDRMEEFHADEEFAELLERLSREHDKDQVDLVLLGDVMDLWTTITDPTEVNAQTPDEVDFYFPADPANPTKFSQAVQNELIKAKAVMCAHPKYFEALGWFLKDDPGELRKIRYVPGNHDHSIADPKLQDEVRKSILTAAGLKEGSPEWDRLALKIQFPWCYEDEYLQVYAEHGNQLTFGGAFRYEEFQKFGKECPGYYELKLVWNRLERGDPEFDNVFMGAQSPANWPGLWWWLLAQGHFRDFAVLRKFRTQYEEYENDQGVQAKIDPAVIAAVKRARDAMPAPWRTVLYLLKSGWFGATRDEFSDQVPQLFDQNGTGEMPLCGHRLDPQKTKTVILGHSHQAKDRDLPNLEGVKYYNTGSWIFRYENGRRLVEQVWVSISREIENAGAPKSDEGDDGPRPAVIDRQMVRRKVEFPQESSSPVTPDGQALNPVIRELQDIRVGDLVLFRWNFGAQLWRLLKRLRILEIARVIPEMAGGWFNRYGTSSHWNHIALVYGSPAEKAESKNYNDPLIIEAIPETGVSIHTPQHYLEYPKDYDIAVLRLEEKGGSRLLTKWENRLLLRRFALGSLESHYDSSVIASQTLLYSARAMDTQGRSAVGGLVKGAICGVVGGTALLIEEIVSSFYKNPDQWNERMMTVESAFSTMWAEVYRWAEVHGLVFDDLPNQILSWDYVLLVLIVVGLAVLLFGAALYAMLSILRVAGKTWLYLTAAFGAAVGVLIVPLMADLSEDWVEKTPAWRWAITLVWLAIPVVTLLALLGETGSRKTAGAAALLATLVVVWCSTPFTWLVERMIIRPVKWAAQKAENLSTWVYKKLGWTVAKEPVDEKYAPHKQFICSGLVQDALVKTAAALKVPAEDVIANLAEWEENKKSPAAQESVLKNTLPKDFAASDKFRWTYLYVDGALTPKPSESHKAEASTDSLKEIKGRKLCLKAAWSLRVALLGLYVTVIYGWTHDLHGIEPPWSLLILGGLCGLLALLLASLARRELALRPKEIRGRALKNWGGVLGAVALLIVLVQGGLLATMATPPEAWLEVVWVMPLVIAVAAVALFVF